MSVLNFPIERTFLSPSRYWLKSPYSMTPEGITVHNTANNVSARREASFALGNDWDVMVHYWAGEDVVVQTLPLNRNGWHASDGASGFGNRKTIAIEICRSTSDLATFSKAEDNGARLCAYLLHTYGWDISRMKQHFDYARDKKNCPHRTRAMGWERYVAKVKGYLKELEGTTPNTTDKMPRLEFIDKIRAYAISGWSTHRILPSLTIAQAILESDGGNSELAVKANAIFGIKAHTDPNWKNTYRKTTWEVIGGKKVEVVAEFKAYESWEESMKDRLTYLTTRQINGKYIYEKVIGIEDYKEACQAIYEAGYATDPKYPQKLISIIEQYKLYELDRQEEELKKIVIAYAKDGDTQNALALLNALGSKAILIKAEDVTDLKAKEVIQVGGHDVKGATVKLIGEDRAETLVKVAEYLKGVK